MKDANNNQNEMPEKVSLIRVVLIIVLALSLIIYLIVFRNFNTRQKNKNEDVAAEYVDPEQSAKKTNLPDSYDDLKKKETSDKKPLDLPKKRIEELDNTPMNYDVKPSKLLEDSESRFNLTTRKQKPKSPYVITQGTLIPCVLDTGICSEPDVRRYAANRKKRKCFAVPAFDNGQQHLFVIGSVYGFIVTRPSHTDGFGPYAYAAGQREQQDPDR